MTRPPRPLVAIALGLALVLAPAAPAIPAVAAGADTPPVPVGPEDGAFVAPGEILLTWTPRPGAQYEVQWAQDGAVDAGGVIAEGSHATVGAPRFTVVAESGGSYVWQVRVLPDGVWSPFATFYADVELPTLALPEDGADPAAGATPDPTAVALPGDRGGVAAIPAGVWIGGAVTFALLLLLAVFVQARRRPGLEL